MQVSSEVSQSTELVRRFVDVEWMPNVKLSEHDNRHQYTSVPQFFTARHTASFASAVYATTNPSVRLSVRVRHTPVLCQNEGMQRNAVFTVG